MDKRLLKAGKREMVLERDIIEVLCSLGCGEIIETTLRHPVRRCYSCQMEYIKKKALEHYHKKGCTARRNRLQKMPGDGVQPYVHAKK